MTKPTIRKIRTSVTVALASIAFLVAGLGLLVALPKDGPVRLLIVRTGSMTPKIAVGSLIFVAPQANYGVGDVVTYRLQDAFVTHRIIAVADGRYELKGDANNAPDGQLVAPEDVVGKLRASIPAVGNFLTFVKTPLGFSLFIVLPALGIVIQEIFAIGKEAERSLKRKRSARRIVTDIHRVPSRARLAAEAQRESRQSRKRVGEATALLLVALIAGVGGTKAYFSNLGLSSNNVLNTSQFIATTLVINELVYNSSCPNPQNTQAIEFWNGSSSTVNLKDWKLRDQNANIVQIVNSNMFLAPGQFGLVAKSWGQASNANNCYGPEPPGTPVGNLGGSVVINTTSGFLELLDPSNIVIDKVAYGGPNPSAAADKSIERRQLGFDTALGNGFNASDFISQFPATLGFALPTPQSVVLNEFQIAPNGQEFIELFNKTTSSINIGSWTISRADGTVVTTIAPGTMIAPRHTITYAGNTWNNAGEKIFLKNSSAAIQDAFSYFKFAPPSGQSWTRIPDGANNWQIDTTPTPSAVNAL